MPKKNEIRYPEFEPLIETLTSDTLVKIKLESNKIDSKMPYKFQYVLEETIKRLKEWV